MGSRNAEIGYFRIPHSNFDSTELVAGRIHFHLALIPVALMPLI
ncbi:hypothetical protein D1BOALGB6SA_1185 [Olavius sp. associated proteobacterium Delta 1]|nr:hypothetical protein D1BOALGB6SA_1185 [Olavius sp. associated proteobacterium Delta 1]